MSDQGCIELKERMSNLTRQMFASEAIFARCRRHPGSRLLCIMALLYVAVVNLVTHSARPDPVMLSRTRYMCRDRS